MTMIEQSCGCRMCEKSCYRGIAELYHKPATLTGHRLVYKVDTAAGSKSGTAYSKVDKDCICWMEDKEHSMDHSEGSAACKDTVVDMVDTADTEHTLGCMAL